MLSDRATPAPPGGTGPVPPWGTDAGPDAIVAWAPAKVNLTLEVLGKRPDGYHAVETLMLAVDLFDTLEVRRTDSPGIELVCHPPGLPTDGRNLVVKAGEALRAAFAPSAGAAVRLTKRIPHEAGLGGGSSDAATALLALDRVWRLNRSADELAAVAGTVGSDVAFFLTPPAGWCTGRGEVVTPEPPPGGLVHLVIVKPAVGLSTADVYRRVVVPDHPVDASEARAALRAGDVEALAGRLVNRLQGPAFAAEPAVEAVYRTLVGCVPLAAQLSGSGSAVFALCRDRAHSLAVATAYRAADPGSRVYAVRGWPSVGK